MRAAISIHAPLRGRPTADGSDCLAAAISIHAPLRGRPALRSIASNIHIFQSTPPCGGDRHGRQSQAGCSHHFNPRPLAGATGTLQYYGAGRTDFNPRPLAGATCQTGQLEFYKRFRLFSRKSVHGSPKPHFPVLVPSVCFPFALTAPWELLGHRSFWLPGAGFCSDTCFPGCRTASCRGLCR